MPYDVYQLDEESNEVIWKEVDHDYIREDTISLDIVFRNDTHGWALSQNKTGFGDGIILYTKDSGLTWNLQFYNETAELRQILINGPHLWVTTNGGLLHSINDGRSWDYVPIDDEQGFFYGIFFYNKTLGWTGSERGLYKTVDEGKTWNKTMSFPYEGRARDIYFTTPTSGWIIHSYGIYHTTDGGDSWEQQHDRGGWSFSFVGVTEAWAVGDYMLAHMTDGNTWVEQTIPSDMYSMRPDLTGVYFLNATYGWITGSNPLVGHTQNGGADWYEQSVPIGTRYNAVWFYNETLGWAIGWGGNIIRTSRGNELGTYSWGSSNVALIYGVGFVLIAIVAVSVIFLRFRKRPSAVSPAPELE